MKRKQTVAFWLAGLGIAACLAWGTGAQAAVILSDNFDSLSAGELNGQGGWFQFWGGRTGSVLVDVTDPLSSPNHVKINASSHTPAGAGIQHSFSPSGYYAPVWASVMMKVTARGIEPGHPLSFGRNGDGQRGMVMIRPNAGDTGKFDIGAAVAPGSPISDTYVDWSGTALNLNEWYNVVLQYFFNGSNWQSNVYVNPADLSALPVASKAGGAHSAYSPNVILFMGERSYVDSHAAWGDGLFDNLVVGESFFDVFTEIPEPSTLGLLVLGGLLMLVRGKRQD